MFGITTELPMYYSIICILLGVVYAYFLYRKNNFQSKILTSFLFVFRALVVFVLSFLLLHPITTILHTTEEKPIIVLAQDASISCQNSEDFNKFTQLQESLSDNFEVVSYHYSDEVSEGFVSEKKGVSTNVSNIMDEVDLKFSGRNLLGVVLSSDGLYNNGSNPLYHKISKSVPFYTIPLGDTSVIKDIRISKVLHNEISFLGNTSPVQVHIKTDKCKGENIKIKLYSGNKLLQSKSIKVVSNSDFIKADFKIENNRLSLQKYKVVVSGIDNEPYTDNNSNSFFIDVIDSKYKILLLSDVVHPDISAFKSVLDKNKNYQVEIASPTEFTSSFKEYNLVVTFYISNKKSDVLISLKQSNVPLLMFVSPNSVSLLNSFYPEGSLSGKNKMQEVTATYNSSFSKFNASPSLQNYFADLPPLYSTFAKYNSSVTSEIIAYQNIGMYATEKPLITLDETLDRKTAIVYAQGIWKWKINDRRGENLHQNFDELFSKISQYLLIKEDKSRFRVSHNKKIQQGKPIEFTAEYYNDNYELNNVKEVSLSLKNEEGKLFNYMFSKTENASYFLNINSLSPSKYYFTATYNTGEEVTKGQFSVLPKQSESSVNTANHQLLYQLSNQSNGFMFPSFNVEQIKDTLVNSSLNRIILHTSEKVESVINKMWILIFLLLLLCTEWIVRKYNGFY